MCNAQPDTGWRHQSVPAGLMTMHCMTAAKLLHIPAPGCIAHCSAAGGSGDWRGLAGLTTVHRLARTA